MNSELLAMVCLVLLPPIFVWGFWSSHKGFHSAASSILEKHVATLAKKKLEATTIDEYGNVLLDVQRWNEEKVYFIEHVLKRDFPRDLLPTLPHPQSASYIGRRVDRKIDDAVEAFLSKRKPPRDAGVG